ncbi:transcription factor HES-5-like isoform X2 [Lissotriton helveticus]
MAPYPSLPESPEGWRTTQNNKQRKPAVEKMRRDRINTSIEQLRRLLEKEIEKEQPQCRLEKADILEITVAYIEQQRRHEFIDTCLKSIPDIYHQGYIKCLRETAVFLNANDPWSDAQRKLIDYIYANKSMARKQVSPSEAWPSSALLIPQNEISPKSITKLWRPW